jgi:hypothetical protein
MANSVNLVPYCDETCFSHRRAAAASWRICDARLFPALFSSLTEP